MSLTPIFLCFFIFLKIFAKIIRKNLHIIKNDYTFAMISEMKYGKTIKQKQKWYQGQNLKRN